jgi:membrane protein implicated in regulation of membrane protease activity
MQFRKSHLAPAVAAIAAVLAPAVTLVVGGDPVEALLLFVVVAVLAGMYMLRRYARAELIYRRRPERHRRHAEAEPVSSAPAART